MRADPDTATSRALAVALALGGLTVFCNRALIDLVQSGPLPPWAAFLVVPEVLAFCAVFDWVLRLRRTIPAGTLRTRFGDSILRIAQTLALLYGVNSVREPELRIRQFFGSLDGHALWSREVFELFVAPLALAMLLWMLAVVLCLNRDLPAAERVRLVAFMIAVPIIATALVLPTAVAPAATVLGLCVLLAGALRHAELNGRQGQFMSRFLSPQVAALVQREGLRGAMREERREISIVCVDVRGFTAFAAAARSEEVISLLRDYYDAVGVAVQASGGTIKDYAGDGVLILLGAPVPDPAHADHAVELAERILADVRPQVRRAGRADTPLGLGLGVASGAVTVGVVGGAGPLEYAAVGASVNLAARLCEHAQDGEIVIAAETHRVLTANRATLPVARAPLMLKGYAEPVPVFALAVP
jgi:class 3 adenylate cyclase